MIVQPPGLKCALGAQVRPDQWLGLLAMFGTEGFRMELTVIQL